MKKSKLIGIAALAAMLGLTGCNLLGGEGGTVTGGTCKHEWSAWEIIEAPTCMEKGVRERTCYICEKTQTRTINIDTTYGHDWMDDPANDTVATCTEPGISGSQVCKRCYLRKKGAATELGNHVWADAVPQPEGYEPAKCTETGLIKQVCEKCSATQDLEVKALGHSAGDADFSGGKMGIVRCSRKNCEEVMAYELDIKDAEGFHTPLVRMGQRTGTDSKATWDISSYIGTVIPAGSYDIQLEAAMTDSTHGTRKLYNMARKDLMVDGDLEGNDTQGAPDDVTDSPYRYFIKVDSTTYYPTTKESYADLGLQVGNTNFRYCNFLEGVSINKDSSKLELIHGDIGYSLFIKSIRFTPHTHDIQDHDEPTLNGRTGYLLDKCYCGYRYFVAQAKNGVYTARDENLPNEYLRLPNDEDSVTYTFNVQESITGSLFLVGRQAIADLDKNPYELTVTCNDEEIKIDKTDKVSSKFFKVEGNTDLDGYSNEGRILIGEITLKENAKYGNNIVKITRKGEGNIAMTQIVIEARPTGHIHDFVRDPSRDTPATCTSDEKQYSYCSCGQETKKTITGTKKPHELVEKYRREPTCEQDGMVDYVCANCGYSNTVTLPKAHNFNTVTPTYDEAKYELKKCTKCENGTEATWTLNSELIKDNGGTTSAVALSGKMSDNINDFTVYKFDAANRAVSLKYYHEGSNPVEAMFSIRATAKVEDISKTYAYKQETGTSDKLELTVNESKASYIMQANKTLADLGLKDVASKVAEGGSFLADPVWMDYYKVALKPGVNDIEINFPEDSQYSLYIGGFRLSY